MHVEPFSDEGLSTRLCTGPVLVTDFRDTFFQGDPFGEGTHQVTGLEVFQEHKTQTTQHWIIEGPVRDCKGITFDEPMLCSGTTIGTREAMLKYLSIMQSEMMDWMQDPKCCCNKMNGDDQSIHNYLFYTGKLPFATAMPNRMGTVNTVGVQGSMIFNAHKKTWKDQNFTQDKAVGKPYEGADEHTQGNKWIGIHFDLVDEEVRICTCDAVGLRRLVLYISDHRCIMLYIYEGLFHTV
jgi:hypothetical protein